MKTLYKLFKGIKDNILELSAALKQIKRSDNGRKNF